LDLSGVLPRPGADLFGDVDALLDRLKEGHKLGHVLALALGLQGTALLGNLKDNTNDNYNFQAINPSHCLNDVPPSRYDNVSMKINSTSAPSLI
jgi:hypothetical protein